MGEKKKSNGWYSRSKRGIEEQTFREKLTPLGVDCFVIAMPRIQMKRLIWETFNQLAGDVEGGPRKLYEYYANCANLRVDNSYRLQHSRPRKVKLTKESKDYLAKYKTSAERMPYDTFAEGVAAYYAKRDSKRNVTKCNDSETT